MDGLAGAASVIAVVDISAKVASLCSRYFFAVKDAKKDIKRLKQKVTDIKNVLEKLQQLLDKQDQTQLSTTRRIDSLEECYQQLQELKRRLERGRGSKTMQRFGFRALKWPFTSKQVEKIVNSLEQNEHTFSLALEVDQTGVILSLDRILHLVDKKTDTLLLPTALGASFDSHMEEHNSTCLPDTRTELLHHIQEWVKDENSKPIFWLNGAAGTGKSTIARTVAQTLADQGQLGASFFFKRGEGECSNAKWFLTTIATQLARRVPDIQPKLAEAIDADPAISDKAFKNQFEQLILLPLQEVANPPALVLILVIDALDECEQHNDIRVILQLLSQNKGPKPLSLRILVTSRPEFHIRLGFKQMPDGTYDDLILHEVSKETIEHDISVYLEHELTKTREERSLPPDWPGERRIQTLVNMAVPLFIFAATACRFVGELSGNPRRRLDDILEYDTVGVSKLDMTYLPILTSIFVTPDDKEKRKLSEEFQEIVGSIVLLESPLSINSLARLLGKDKVDVRLRLDSLHSVLSIPDRDDVSVRLLHLSFREFLMDTSNENSLFWVDKKARHEKLASRCIELLSGSDGLRQNICGLQPGTLRSDIDEATITSQLSPELQYACRYWVRHLELGECRINDKDSIFHFVVKHFLCWLEVMSIIGEAYKCISNIDGLRGLAESDSSVISSFLHDAKRFTLHFRFTLDNAPLQIYSSALIFAPELSILRNTFANDIPGWVSRLSKSEMDWDACRSTLEGHSGTLRAVAFSPNGHLLASASHDGALRLWQTATGSCQSTLEGHSSWVLAIAFSPSGHSIASASRDRTIRIWDVATESCYSTLNGHSSWVSDIAFSPDGQLIASASGDKTVRLWDTATGSCRSIFQGHADWIYTITFSPSGKLVASGSQDKTVRIWEVETGSCYTPLQSRFETGTSPAMAFSPDGQFLACGSIHGVVQLCNIAARSCFSMCEGHYRRVNAIAFAPDGQLVATASADHTIGLWHTVTGSCFNILKGHSQGVNAVAFSPNSQLVASASDDSTIRLWEVTGSCRSTLHGHSSMVSLVIFSPDSQLVASACPSPSRLERQTVDTIIRLWDAARVPYCSTPEGHLDKVTSVAFSSDNQLVASASEDRTIRLWDANSGNCYGSITCPEVVRLIFFSRDKSYLITNQGKISIPFSVPNIPSFRCLPPQVSKPCITVENSWITFNNQRILWLPVEYRPSCKAVGGDVICLGHISGGITLLKFDLGRLASMQALSNSARLSSE